MPRVCLDPAKVKTKALIGYILAEMKEQNVTYQMMGEELGITQQGFSKKKKRMNFTIEDFIRMCSRLGIESEIKTIL